MKTIALALLMLLTQAAADESRIADLIRSLASEEIQTRDRAQKVLREFGKAAIPQLRKAVDDPDAERRARVRALIAQIEWVELKGRPVLQDLTDEEKKFLGEVGSMTRTQPRTLLLSLQAHGPPPSFAHPNEGPFQTEVWSFIRPDLFENAIVKGLRGAMPTLGNGVMNFEQWTGATPTALLTRQVRYDHLLRGPSGIHRHLYLPYALLETCDPLDLSAAGLTWDAKQGLLPCLGRYMVPGPKNVTLKRAKTFEKDGKTTGAYYEFEWARTGKMDTLRHLFVKERWALFIVGAD